MPLVNALRSPFSCVPPSPVGIVLQYEREKPSSSAIQAIAHSTEPCLPSYCTFPPNTSLVTGVWPSIEASR